MFNEEAEEGAMVRLDPDKGAVVVNPNAHVQAPIEHTSGTKPRFETDYTNTDLRRSSDQQFNHETADHNRQDDDAVSDGRSVTSSQQFRRIPREIMSPATTTNKSARRGEATGIFACCCGTSSYGVEGTDTEGSRSNCSIF